MGLASPMRSHLPRILSQEEGIAPTGHLFLPSCTRMFNQDKRHYQT
ncbi:hypothetical protein ACP6PL_26110 [Dapis sp. BLCC M126]